MVSPGNSLPVSGIREGAASPPDPNAEIAAAVAMLDSYDAPTHDEGDGGPLSLAERIEAMVYRDAVRPAARGALAHGQEPDPMLDEFIRLNAAWLTQQKTNRDLWAALHRIVDHYDARSEIYTNDADLADAMAGIARQALQPPPTPSPDAKP